MNSVYCACSKRAVDQFAGQESLRLPAGIAPRRSASRAGPTCSSSSRKAAREAPCAGRHAEPLAALRSGARFTRHYAGSVATCTRSSACSTAPGAEARGDDGRGPASGALPRAAKERLRGEGALRVLPRLDGPARHGVRRRLRLRPQEPPRRRRVGRSRSPAPRRRTEDGGGGPARSAALHVRLPVRHDFNYFHPPGAEPFKPAWDGSAGLKAPPRRDDPNCAKNAAHALDGTVEEFLAWFERSGKRPVVLFTGDHGEEFKEKGHLGHGSAVTNEQIHTPFVILGDGIPPSVRDEPTSHVDVVPIFSPRGHAPAGAPLRRRVDVRGARGSVRALPSDGSRVTRWSGKTSRSRCTPASPARRSPTPTTGRSQTGTHASPRTQGGSCVRCAARRSPQRARSARCRRRRGRASRR